MEALAGKHRATFAGSLPWADDHHGLARTEQLRTVAAVVTANLNDSSYD